MVEDLIRDVAESLGSWAYLLVAVMACAETAAFLGFIAPGEFTIIIGGVLAGEGTLSIQLLIGIVWASIVLGDSIGFYIGRRAGRNFLLKHGPRVRLTEERIKQVEAYIERHGGKTIFFGRWVGFVRPLMPFTAGTSGFFPYSKPGLANPSGEISTSLSTRSEWRAAKFQAILPPIELPIRLARARPSRSIRAPSTCTLRASV